VPICAPEYMTAGLHEEDGTVTAEAVDGVLALQQDIVVCGPGLGRTAHARAFVHGLVERAAVPLLLDADAIMAFVDVPDALLGQDGREVIITPHPGEMAALAGLTVEEVQANRLDVACQFATDHHVYVVLKGHRTVVATPAGRAFINPTGNPGMATGGTGDVLSGMLAAWLAQLLDAEAACQLAVFLHGAAGDLAAAELGQVAMISGDLLRHVGAATERLRSGPDATA